MLGLLKKRSFGAMTLSQFLGAFNDNAFKQVIVLLATAVAAGAGPGEAMGWVTSHPMGGGLPSWLSAQAIPPFLFSLPFVIFGPLTGSLADRVSKSRIIQVANFLEIVVMGVATLAFWLTDYGVLLGAVFLMGTQSAIFGPSKYGCIKEMVGSRELSRANALIQSSTMIAVLAGVFLGGIFRDQLGDRLWMAGVWYVAFATLGWLCSLRIEPLPAADPGRPVSWNPVSELMSHWRATEGQRHLVLSIIASSFFYLMAASFLIVIPTYGRWMGLSDTHTSVLTAMPGLGIIAGAVIAGRVSGDRIEGGLIPLGLLGMAASLLATSFAPVNIAWVSVCLLGMGLFSGLFTIPVRCLIQSLPREEKRGAVQGLAEVMDFVGILLATPLFIFWDKGLALEPPQMFVVGGVIMALGGIASLVLAGEFLVRLVLLTLTHTLYRLRVSGGENLPEEGGALLVANHVSFVDGMLVGAVAQRPARFLVYRDYLDLPVIGSFARRMGFIPVSSGDTPEEKAQALDEAAQAAREGSLVCIFAEGSITRTGTMLPFAKGLEVIARGADVPIIPIGLDRLWGSIFSFEGGSFFWKWPHRLPYPVDVVVGKPLPSDTPAGEVRNAIQEAIATRRSKRDGRAGSLAWRFVVSAKLNRRRMALVDSGGRMSYGALLVEALALARVFDRRLGQARRVGVILESGMEAAIVHLALTLSGRVAVPLYPGLSADGRAALLGRARAQAWIGDAADSAGELSGHAVAGLRAAIRPRDRWRARALSRLPAWALARLATPQSSAREVAAVLFTAGTTGSRKAVELSHGNILSNVQSLLEVLHIGPRDRVLSPVPLANAFGYTVGLWTTLLSGGRALLVASDGEQGADLCSRVEALALSEKATVIYGSPADFAAFTHKVDPAAFADLWVAACAAAPLEEDVGAAFAERFGVLLCEGYGLTECAPVVSFNIPGAERYEGRQMAHRPGSIGRPLPGVAVRVVDRDSGAVLPQDHSGELQVKGPNVMLGYVGDPESGASADGWLSTGDLAHIDRGGFLIIDGRSVAGEPRS
jgi:acyl-[acyl-carrier-protein]-phospholipid O-acyltransferase/long-chain-fatty-acid--[acyl-carrier-protein] ligase